MLDKQGLELSQFFAMCRRQNRQDIKCLWCQSEQSPPAIGLRQLAANKTQCLEPVYQLGRGVRFHDQAPCNISDRRFVGRRPADRQQRLVLLRLQPRFRCLGLAENLEAPQRVPEFGQCGIIDVRRIRSHERP